MASGRITKAAVDALTPGARDAFLWDVSVRGFGVKVTPAGNRVYVLQYRMGGRGAKTKRYTIGAHGSWTPDAAQREAKRLLMLVGQGVDPADDKRRRVREATDLTFDAVADRFEALEVPSRWPKSAPFVSSALRLHLRPKLGKRPLPSITGAELRALVDDLRGGPALKRNVYAVARRLFRWAKGRGEIETNPLEGVEGPRPVASRDRVLDDGELRLVWLASSNLNPAFRSLVRLLMLLGQRRDEVAALDWRELDRARAEWLLPSARAKNGQANLVPLPAAAIAELDELAGGTDWPRKGFVLTTDGGQTRISGFSRAKAALDRHVAALVDVDAPPLPSWRLHDLRRSMATGLQRHRIAGDWIEALQNRRKAGVAGVYQRHHFADEKRLAVDVWGAHVTGLVGGDLGNVVPISAFAKAAI